MTDRTPNPRGKTEEAARAANRLPPGQSLTRIFPVLHVGLAPQVDLADWRFRVWGEVEEERSWNWDEFDQLPQTTVTLDLHCVTRWSMLDTTWEGVSLGMLVEEGYINPKSTAQHVIQHCEQGYTTNTPIDMALSKNMLMATKYNGSALDIEHGYPLRMVIGALPDRLDEKTAYLWKGGKWLRGLEFLSQDRLGFWEQGGYHNVADPWREERFAWASK
jgi:DMSO/TMAO reductase YedYZ molybdopterin-dependent catalytic subunit